MSGRHSLTKFVLAFSAALALPVFAQASTVQYSLTILGLVQHDYWETVFIPTSINDNGVVAGYAQVKVPHNKPLPVRGILWQSTTHYTVLGTISESGFDSEATAINNSGIAVGYSTEHIGSGYFLRPVMFTPSGVVDLGVRNAEDGYATAINNVSQVVGYLYFDTPVPAFEAFLYQNGLLTPLGYPVPTIGYSIAYAINDSGLIVGAAKFALGDLPHPAGYVNGVWNDLGTLGTGTDFRGYASSVNASGAIVGSWSDSVQTNPGVFLYQNGKIVDLKAPAGAGNGQASPVINNAGQIIAGIFIYQDGVWQDIHNLMIPRGEWQISQATGINNQGVITGIIYDGITRAGLFTPVNSSQEPEDQIRK